MFRLYLEFARVMSPDRDNGKMASLVGRVHARKTADNSLRYRIMYRNRANGFLGGLERTSHPLYYHLVTLSRAHGYIHERLEYLVLSSGVERSGRFLSSSPDVVRLGVLQLSASDYPNLYSNQVQRLLVRRNG